MRRSINPLATPRYDDVHILLQGDQFTDGRPIGDFEHLHGVFGEPRFLQPLMDARGNGLIRVDRLRAAAKDRCVA